ncbi:hypothetical protein FHETE_1645 [Fusarium heterosporum]|uniref:RING-type domain-containing protein n=1 Tax=Fusarium heterosporum TaxID=42747 RepID=A0A8H5TYQ1_FUSHE|nr:hypothetical protein FHETE_1645 [Fusarium heterosporum]
MSINETYFPALMDILSQDPSATESLNLECPICRDVMTTNNEDKVSYSNDEADVNHGAFVLPCGHIIGYSCSREIYNYSTGTGIPHRCPTCRFDLIHTSCQHSHNIGTMLRVGEAQRHSMRLSVENSSRVFDYCVECCLPFIFSQLRGIAMAECDFSSVLTGRRVLILTINKANMEWKSESRLRNTTLVTNLPVFDALKSTNAALGRFLEKLLNLPADEPADFECRLNLYEGGPGENIDSYLRMQNLMVQVTERRLMGMDPATRNATARNDARSFCSLLENGALSQLLTRARLARQTLVQRVVLDLD